MISSEGLTLPEYCCIYPLWQVQAYLTPPPRVAVME
jgi:hypothetical protein